jgi:hypothetical protein
VRDRGQSLTNLAKLTAAKALRLVPGATSLRLKRDLRDSAWISEADAVVISYPKSGRTFVRAMLARLYQLRFGIDERQLLEFPLLRRAPRHVPRVLFTHAGDAMRRPGEIRMDGAAYARKKVVLIARYPADIAVSRYHHLKHRSRNWARRRLAAQPIESFVWANQGGIPSIVEFLNQAASTPGATIIRYEDFLENPEQALKRLAGAIGLEVGDSEIADAVAFAHLPSLKQREQQGYFISPRLRPARKGDERSSKVRSGSKGGYRDQLGDDAVGRIEEYVEEHLSPVFGYSRVV